MRIEAQGRSIGQVIASLSSRSGGVGVVVEALARALSGHGEAVQVYGVRDEAFAEERERWQGVRVRDVRPWRGGAFAYSPELGPALAAGGHDLVHLHGLWLHPSIAVSTWGRRSRRPVLISPHGMLDPWALRNAAWKKALALTLFERRNLERASCLHVLNDSEAGAVRRLGLNAPLAVIPNGVRLPPGQESRPRPGFLAGDDRRILLFLGRIHPKKGLAETIQAWAALARGDPKLVRDWTLVLAGWDDGGHLETLREQVRSLSLDGHVHLPGGVMGEVKADLLRNAEAFILASHSEGLPMAVLEAWAYSTPVLMTAACNLPEGFAAGAAVEIPTAPAELAQILAEQLARPDLAAIGARGRRLVEQRFTWPQVAREMSAVYAWLLSGGAAPPSVRLP